MKANDLGISVVIPYYNGGKYIQETIRSLRNALNFANVEFEIIIVNDSPNDNIESYIDENIKVINNLSNQGVAYSRNTGKKAAKFAYIYFIDQDDLVEESFFIEAIEYIKKEYDVIIFNYKISEKNSNKTHYNFLFKYYFKYISAKNLLKYGNVFRSPGQMLMKKTKIGDFIETENMGSDDFYMFVDIFFKKNKLQIKYVDKPLFKYRIHGENYTKKAKFYKSSIECFTKYKIQNPSVIKYEKYLISRYSNNKLISISAKIRFFLITI